MEKKKCILCKKEFEGFGNNPAPLSTEGVCCDMCNFNKVVPARIDELREKEKALKKINEEKSKEFTK